MIDPPGVVGVREVDEEDLSKLSAGGGASEANIAIVTGPFANAPLVAAVPDPVNSRLRFICFIGLTCCDKLLREGTDTIRRLVVAP